MTRFKLLAASAAVAISSGAVQASVFDFITVNYTASSVLTTAQNSAVESLFAQAENFYETTISGYADGFSLPASSFNPDGKVNIDASVTAIDGVNGVLAQAGPQFLTCSLGGLPSNCSGTGNTYYTVSGVMDFDEADIVTDLNSGRLEQVILHEMAHVLGFGTLWELNGLYTNGSGQYTAPNALAAYQAECDASATFIPVELDGGAGTANGHWDEVDFACGSNDLMTGFIGSGANPFSQTSLAAFEDLGYVLAAPPAIPLPAGGVLMLTAAGAFAFARRRKAA